MERNVARATHLTTTHLFPAFTPKSCGGVCVHARACVLPQSRTLRCSVWYVVVTGTLPLVTARHRSKCIGWQDTYDMLLLAGHNNTRKHARKFQEARRGTFRSFLLLTLVHLLQAPPANYMYLLNTIFA